MINNKFNLMGISLFTDKINQENLSATSPSPSPAPAPSFEIKAFKTISDLEDNLLKIVGEQIDNDFLDRSKVTVPDNSENFIKYTRILTM